MCNNKKAVFGLMAWFVLTIGLLNAQQEFHICGCHAKTKEFFDTAPQVVNRIEIQDVYSTTVQHVLDKLDEAEIYGLKVMCAETKSAPGSGPQLLEWHTRRFWTNWEVDSVIFEHARGGRVIDFQAQDWDAWKVDCTAQEAGFMLEGPNPTCIRNDESLVCTLLLKIDEITTAPVCRFEIWKKRSGYTPQVAEFEIDGSDFEYINGYQEFCFSVGSWPTWKINYKLYWYGNVDLWCDYIDTRCPEINRLLAGEYVSDIKACANNFEMHPALEYYYLLDEPDIGNYAACRYVMDSMEVWGYKPTLQIHNYWYPDIDIYETYLDSVKPEWLLTDIYLWVHSEPITLQWRIDWLMDKYMEARKEAKARNVPLGIVVQAEGEYTSDHGGDPAGYLRLPTYYELRCNVWLGLALGAKAIWYYLYETLGDGQYWQCGLIDAGGIPREPIWSAAVDMKHILMNPFSGIGSKLLTLSSDTVFCNHDEEGIPNDCYIVSVSNDDTVQIGTLIEDTSAQDYFIIVNRSCQPGVEYRLVTIGIDKTRIYLKDEYTGQIIYPDFGPGDPLYFTLAFEAGQGRLFRIMNSFGDDGVQNKSANSVNDLTLAVHPTIANQYIKIQLRGIENYSTQPCRVEIYDAVGKMVKGFNAITSTIIWDGTDDLNRKLSKGIYFVRMSTHEQSQIKKVILLK